MELEEIYKLIEGIGCLSFSTLSESGEIHSRIAHFNGFDENGFYFRTMTTKPYFRQLMKTKKITVSGINDPRIFGHSKEGVPHFPPCYWIRLIGDIRHVPDDIIFEKAKTNRGLLTAAQDMEKYPTMRGANFVLYRAKGEVFDADFELAQRQEHKLLRRRFSFGGASFNEAGPYIKDRCVECGECAAICSFDAIEKGSPYRINPIHCDDCGMCRTACPVDAFEDSLEF